MSELRERQPSPSNDRRTTARLLVGFSVGVLALAAVLLTIVFPRLQKTRNPLHGVVALNDTIDDPAEWGKNFPLQYDDYRRTVDQVRTRYGGSEAVPRTPSEVDPRSVVAQSHLEEDPRLREFWAGYPFARDYREERGHAYMLSDQEFSERSVAREPGTCLHCHASVYVAYRRAGKGDLMTGFDALSPLPYAEARKQVRHPVSCIDCHDPESLQLRVTRPAFIEGIRLLKALQGILDYDVNSQASRQEMRTFVCGQCHVEYYFLGPRKRLQYPWGKGITADSILAYYDATGHVDWNHSISGARVLKAQHPEFELYSQGIHARSGVACADCHMPDKGDGAKVSDHHVRSPMLNVGRACQTCHSWSVEELGARVATIQDRTFEMRNMAIDSILHLAREIGDQVRRGSTAAGVGPARDYQRKAQFLADFIEAENSMGFHADREAARILARAIEYARLGQMALRGVTRRP